MPATTDHPVSGRTVRQLRRTRLYYLGGFLLWAALTAWTGLAHPGSRQMWVSALLVTTFAVLLLTASRWLRRLEAARAARPARRTPSSHRAAGPRHA
ncbi:hypothetical protein ACGFZL_24420 [Streptomyces sp. NPDC048182]|uniref:hypothetical protein n=1 Tax=unclassified Streptomyces TaxID=2593676 RepID=UPI0033B9061E